MLPMGKGSAYCDIDPYPFSFIMMLMHNLILLLTVLELRPRVVCCSIGHGHPDPSITGTAGVSPQADLIWREMGTLVDGYPLAMDTRAEERDINQRMVLSKFHACLVKLANASSTGHLSISSVFTNKVIMSAYKARGHIIKTMLSSGQYLTIGKSDFVQLPGWNSTTELLEELLGFRGAVMMVEHRGGGAYGEMGVARNMHPLDFAVKLGMVDVVGLLVSSDVKMCQNPHLCSISASALCQAVINQDGAAVDCVLQVTRSESAADEALDQETLLCDLLTLREPSFGRSPVDIAHLQCSSGLNCDTFTHLLKLTQTSCASDYSPHASPLPGHMTSPHGHMTSTQGHLTSPHGHVTSPQCHVTPPHGHVTSPHDLPTCPAHQPSLSLLPGARWLGCVEGGRGCGFSQWSGQWRVYGDHKVGRADCGLLQIAASRITPEEFERDFVNMR